MSRSEYPINLESWLAHLKNVRHQENIAQIDTALEFYTNADLILQLEKGVGIADILFNLGLDNETLAAAIAYPALQSQDIHIDSIAETLGEGSRQLLQDVLQMRSLGKLQHIKKPSNHQIENLRKMLLAMITDVRAVIIILAERLLQLRLARNISEAAQQALANETLAVYAPLANRLGIWQLKWEIEDLCLKYLNYEQYSAIGKGITRRIDRETYIASFTHQLKENLNKSGIVNFEVSGRVKHIYSIYRKMQRKNADLEKIYDMTALRVLVSNVEDCYSVLGVLQTFWEQIPEEFDDYISSPKVNGYRSIHTVLVGPDHHFIEVQIRTYEMHQESELGVASHWRYKEGVLQNPSYEAKIALLRQIMAWQKEVIVNDDLKTDQTAQDLFADRIYVFTPTGDIVDLPKEATPLDFAYQIHSEVGHRCRGAKVNGTIVPLTYLLQTADRVEILTTKQANPSRDWLSPHLGFLKTARARAKVQHWFRVKHSAQNAIDGKALLEKELKKINYTGKFDLNAIALKLNYKSAEDLFSGLGSGDTRIARVLNLLQPATNINEMNYEEKISHPMGVNIEMSGTNNLLTYVARCCKPLPGDSIIGYITRLRGVSIHRRDCNNIAHISPHNPRLMDVNWNEYLKNHFTADLYIRTHDRADLLRDVIAFFSNEKISIHGLQTQKNKENFEVEICVTIEITNQDQLKKAIDHLKNIPSVNEVYRR